MRFSVQHGLQNALFRRVRFSSPAQTPTRLTQKRILAVGPHAKAHSGPDGPRKGALYVIDTIQNAPFGNVATAECALPYSTGCRMRFSVECAFPHLRKRRPASRKSALWPRRLTEKRTLAPAPHGKAHSACVPSPKDALCIPATATKNRCNPSSPQRDPSAVRPGEARRGVASDHPPAVGRRTPHPHPLPQLPASRFLRLENTRSCAWDWVALSGRFGLVSGEWPSLQ